METMSPSGDEAARIAPPLDADELTAVLGADLFIGVPRSSLESVLPRCRVIEIEPGATLIERGLKNDYVFVVLRGRLRVQLDDAQIPHHVLLGPGECVGEISVIDGRGATATVVIAERTRLLRIDRETLWYLIGSTEATARNLLLIFSGRMRRDNNLLLESLGQRRELERMATVDELTGLHNRRWLDDVFARQMERCMRTYTTVSLLFADVDSFKEFNDRYGHSTGDRALQHVAAVLVACLRPTGLIARYGGEEFAVLLPGAALEQAMLVAERVRAALADKPIAVSGNSDTLITITLSLGVAQMQHGDTLATLAAAADAALYRAKSDGRNCVRAEYR
jgi:diguanylate cyclase (GGDEF)-like protein